MSLNYLKVVDPEQESQPAPATIDEFHRRLEFFLKAGDETLAGQIHNRTLAFWRGMVLFAATATIYGVNFPHHAAPLTWPEGLSSIALGLAISIIWPSKFHGPGVNLASTTLTEKSYTENLIDLFEHKKTAAYYNLRSLKYDSLLFCLGFVLLAAAFVTTFN